MDEKAQQPAHWISHEQVKQICTEICIGTAYGEKKILGFDLEDFEPFFQAENVLFWESPVLSITAAPTWAEQTVDELMVETNEKVAGLLALIGFSKNDSNIITAQTIAEATQTAIDSDFYFLGVNIMDKLKEGEVVVVILAAMRAKSE